MAMPRRTFLRWPAHPRPKAAAAGRRVCSPGRWLSLPTSIGCPTRRCARRSKKNALYPRRRRMWCIPDKPSAEFVDRMEDVLEVYRRPDDPMRPVVCLDETFKQLIGETREPPPMRPGAVERFDHVYLRNGTAGLFLAREPLAGWRLGAVTDHRRRAEWAWFVRDLLNGRHVGAERIVLVMDQLNTHSAASFYEALNCPGFSGGRFA
jgi:DDE superfamily endonuclease